MKRTKNIVALALVIVSIFAVALPAFAVETGVLTSNVRIWTNMTLQYHHGYAQKNDRVQVIGTSTMGPDGEIYVKVVMTSGSLSGTEGYVLQRLIKRT